MRGSLDDAADFELGEDIPRVGVLSRRTISSAIERLQREHGLADAGLGFSALQKASQTHNVKLRSVAAAILSSGEFGRGSRRTRRSKPPPLSFTERGYGAQPNRSLVLRDLLQSATTLLGADFGAVQLRDTVHGGLVIENQRGFSRDFLDHFSYLDDTGTACGTTMEYRCQTFVDDVETSSIYTAEDRRMVLEAGVRSVFSTPLCAPDGVVTGAVTVHFAAPHRRPTEADADDVQRYANETATWLRWYDATAMPRIVSSVHAAARRAKAGERSSR